MSTDTEPGEVDVVLLTNMLPPYRIDFFGELAKLCKLHVVADEAVNAIRQWEVPDELPFPCTILGNSGKIVTHKRADLDYEEPRVRQSGKGVLEALKKLRPKVVISGELGMRSLNAARYSFFTKTPLVIWSEGTRYTESRQKFHKRLLRRLIVGRASAFWSNGHESADYLATFGADRDSVAVGITGISTRRFRDQAEKLAPERAGLREKYGLKGTVLLSVGSVSRRKGVAEYLTALRALIEAGAKDFSVVFVGGGDQEDEVKAFAAEHPDVPVVVTGFIKPEEIFPYYAAADVFVLPTLDDNWPLVTIEALASGLPQLISKFNGASADLPKLGPYGEVFDPLDTTSFTSALQTVTATPPTRIGSEDVERAVEYYCPAGQARRAHEAIERARATKR